MDDVGKGHGCGEDAHARVQVLRHAAHHAIQAVRHRRRQHLRTHAGTWRHMSAILHLCGDILAAAARTSPSRAAPISKLFSYLEVPLTLRHRLPVLQGLSKSEEASSCSWLANAAMPHLPWRTLSTHLRVFHDMPQTKHPDTGPQAKVVMH